MTPEPYLIYINTLDHNRRHESKEVNKKCTFKKIPRKERHSTYVRICKTIIEKAYKGIKDYKRLTSRRSLKTDPIWIKRSTSIHFEPLKNLIELGNLV